MKKLLGSLLLLCQIDCWGVMSATKQLPTFADLLNISRDIQSHVKLEGSISDEQARRIIDSIGDGKDRWGTRYFFRTRREPEFSFVLISPGSDRRLDFDDLDHYFEMEQENIVGDLARDIVFRDGNPITIASSK